MPTSRKDKARIEELKAKFGFKYHPAEIAEMSDAELKATVVGKRIKTFHQNREYFGTIVDAALNDRKHPYIFSKYAVNFDDGNGTWVFANRAVFV